MKVVFMDNVEGTAQVGEVKVVKNGFARNFLLPRGLAAPAIEPYLQRAQGRASREAKQQKTLDHDATALAERLAGARITLEARVGEQGKLYGSVTGVHIAQEVAKLIGDEEFDHRKVLLPEAIKEIGIQPVRIRLTRNVEAAIEVEVIAEGGEPEAALEEAPPAEMAEAPAEATDAASEDAADDAVAEETESAGDAAAGESQAEEAEDESASK